MHSMTGFGVGSAPLGQGRFVLEIKTVNHRFLEVRVKAPREFLTAEAMLENLVRKRLSRGYCTISLFYEGTLGGSTNLDEGALKNHLTNLIEVAKDTELCLTDLVPIVTNAPDIFVTPRGPSMEALETAVQTALAQAMDNLLEMRQSEGRAMAEEISKRLGTVNETIDRIDALMDDHNKNAFKALQKRLQAILDNVDVALDSGRLEIEAALMVDRNDISEEVLRIRSHCDQMARLLGSKESSGRKMEFLLQEMAREANTIGSKASLTEISHAVVDVKADLEKIRELVQNIE